MKKILISVLVILMAAFVMARPMGQMGRKGNNNKSGMLFRIVQQARVNLNLTAEQNQKLDNLLREVRDFRTNMMQMMKSKRQNMIDSFVSDKFNPEKLYEQRQKERDAQREKARKFMSGKMVELHNLLTKEQRQKLVEFVKTARNRMMKTGKRPMRPMGPMNPNMPMAPNPMN
jgi:Spy/CpxP family protein refolding chaperone